MFKLFTNHKAGLAVTARTLGLSHDGGHSLSGEHDGIPVGVRLWTQSNGDNTSYYTTVHAGHPVPLRMSLSASRVGAVGRFVRSALGGEDIVTGHPEFDTHFHVRASDPQRAVTLLTQPALRDAMLSVLGARRNNLIVSDLTSSITLNGWHSDVEELRAILNSTYPVASAVRHAREVVPLSDAERRALDSLAGTATATGLALNPQQLTVTGARGRRQLAVRTIYQPDAGWITEFEARFPESLGVGLRLLPQRGLFSAIGELFGTQDIEVGHALFDSTFKVKGQPEAKVAELLSGTVADRILHLNQVARELHVGDEGVRAIAAGLMDETASQVRSIDVVDGLAGAISERAWGGASAPYR
ncbi:MAG: hypothetical protein IPG17_00060 [Sandaracinaceae bacterium]|nr:hypothetical protein [Sandaracinaceae bacterium]MBK6811121.1 hypothetical protein [Sandaracinaceae bacterium]MBK7151821.1 hypothetical protein [Sandaracinaceae bacterium]MBK8411476.1 hypothetical protein [Sandaracinaceae bacterium]